MLHYCLAHTAHHLSRWLPKHDRLKFQIIVVTFVTIVLVPQLYVLIRPKSARFCQQPLLGNLTCSIALTFMASGFAVVLTLKDPIPQALKAAFHAFGVASFTAGLCTTVLTASAAPCAKTTPELYYLSLMLSVGSMLATGFFLAMGGFWAANQLCPGSVLNLRSRTGVCLEPVSSCSCLWHI
ncbi:uncharacterized protein LOC136714048 [Amia ocellicauda]|uniref:uncharacterized protein LOC136714048 n=1 Tax=Amia ocellicauda TaxID=2972642 RepID=UPI0034646AE5